MFNPQSKLQTSALIDIKAQQGIKNTIISQQSYLVKGCSVQF